MNLITRYSRDFQGNMTVDPEGSWVLAGDAVIRDKRLVDRIKALQLLLNNRDDLDDQLTTLEQRRYAEQQAREAAERRVVELTDRKNSIVFLRSILTEAREWLGDGKHADGLAREHWTPEYAAVIDRIEAALNPTAEAVSHE